MAVDIVVTLVGLVVIAVVVRVEVEALKLEGWWPLTLPSVVTRRCHPCGGGVASCGHRLHNGGGGRGW